VTVAAARGPGPPSAGVLMLSFHLMLSMVRISATPADILEAP